MATDGSASARRPRRLDVPAAARQAARGSSLSSLACTSGRGSAAPQPGSARSSRCLQLDQAPAGRRPGAAAVFWVTTPARWPPPPCAMAR